MFGGGANMFSGGGGDMYGGGGDMYGGGGDMYSGGGVMFSGGQSGDMFGGSGGDMFGGSGSDMFGGGGDMYGAGGDMFAAFDPLAGQRFTEVVSYQNDYYYEDYSEAAAATEEYETLTMTAGSGGTTYDWTTELSNNGTTISASGMGTSQYLSGTIANNRLTGADDTIGVFEFTGDSLGANDIIVGETSATTIEGWAATALSSVEHYNGDSLAFIMYDNGSATSTAAVFLFTGDTTTNGITSSELDLIALADVTQDSVTYDNIV
jgi:hypothetical protein